MKIFIKMIEIFSLSNTNPEFIHLLGEELNMIIIKMNILKTPKKILIIGKGKNYFFHPHQHLVSFIIRIIEYIPKNSFIFGIDEEN